MEWNRDAKRRVERIARRVQHTSISDHQAGGSQATGRGSRSQGGLPTPMSPFGSFIAGFQSIPILVAGEHPSSHGVLDRRTIRAPIFPVSRRPLVMTTAPHSSFDRVGIAGRRGRAQVHGHSANESRQKRVMMGLLTLESREKRAKNAAQRHIQGRHPGIKGPKGPKSVPSGHVNGRNASSEAPKTVWSANLGRQPRITITQAPNRHAGKPGQTLTTAF